MTRARLLAATLFHPMIELRTLGVLDLRGPDGTDCRAVLRQPKRLALLAYLAVSCPRRFHRRDTLLGVFWPELDTAHARAALRRAIYFVRRALGDDVIVNRGEDELGLGDDAVWCDATAFDAAIAAGRSAEALDLYHGELLEGFFLDGVPEFERWLDGERAERRSRAATAAWALARSAERQDDAPAAARWARRAAALTPDDEDALRRLVATLDRLGDVAGALRAYDEFARRLLAEYEVEPSPETRAAVAAVRARAGEQRQLPEPPPARPAARPPASADVIAVLPFGVRGNTAFAYLGEGMVDLLSATLDGAGRLRTVDPRAILSFVAREGADMSDAERRRAVADRFGAGRYLQGSVIAAGPQLQIAAALYEADGATVASATVTGEGEADIFGLVDELARHLLAGQVRGPNARLTRLAARTTASASALKCYLRGEAEFRVGRYFHAVDAFRQAVADDPRFALAYYRLAAVLAANAMPELAREAAEAAEAGRERLSDHARGLLDAQRAWLGGRTAEAEGHYNAVLGSYPDDVEAWFLLGDLLFHSNPLRGRSVTASDAALSRALALDPTHVSALGHLVRVAARAGDSPRVEALIGRFLDLSPDGDQALAMRALRAFRGGDVGAQERIIEELVRARVLTVAITFADVALHADDSDGAGRIARRFVAEVHSPDLRALCHTMLAHLAASRERWETVDSEVAAARSYDPVVALETEALLAVLPFRPTPPAALAALRSTLEAWNAEAVPPSLNLALAMHNGLHPHLRLYLLGLVHARLGDADAAEGCARALAAPPATGLGDAATLAANLALGVEAQAWRARGEPARALAVLERLRTDAWFQLTVASPFHALAFERFARAELLEELGRTDEALGWYEALVERSPYELAFLGPSRRARARLGGVSR